MSEITSQTHAHAVVWIDHLVAKIFTIGLKGVSAEAVRAYLPSQHLHHKANAVGDGGVLEDSTFLVRVGAALRECTDLLIIGPGTVKTELMNYLKAARPDLNLHVESSDHPTEREIVALGRRAFPFRPRTRALSLQAESKRAARDEGRVRATEDRECES
jgi:stalled ribosome rescue protein Dom34